MADDNTTSANTLNVSLTTDVAAGMTLFGASSPLLTWSNLFSPETSWSAGTLDLSSSPRVIGSEATDPLTGSVVSGSLYITNWIDGSGFDLPGGEAGPDLALNGAEEFTLTFNEPVTEIGFAVSTGLSNDVVGFGSQVDELGAVFEFTTNTGDTGTLTLSEGAGFTGWVTIESPTPFTSITFSEPSGNIYDQYFGNIVTRSAPILSKALEDQTGTEDAAFLFVVPSDTFADVDDGDILTYAATLDDGSELPSWLSFDPSTRTFSGTPGNDDVGTISVTLHATDTSGKSASDTFNISIANVNDSPTGSPTAVLANGTEDVAYQVATSDLVAGFWDPDGDTLSVANLVSSVGIVTDNGNDTFMVGLPPDFNGSVVLTYDVIDGNGGELLEQTLPFSIDAVNDTAVISGQTSGAVTEDTLLAIDGTLTIFDPDSGENFFVAGSYTSTYGTLTLASQGDWTFTLANANSDVQELNEGETLLDVFVIETVDGTETEISITINGVDEPRRSGETIDGTDGDDTINGSRLNDVINAGSGNDTVSTGRGDDLIQAGMGDDTVSGGDGDDTIYGDAGDDIINGGRGSDIIAGGDGNDVLTGGRDSDAFVFMPGFGNDTITDFDSRSWDNQDTIDVSAFGITESDFATRVEVADLGSDTRVTIDGNANQTILLDGIGNAESIAIDDFTLAVNEADGPINTTEGNTSTEGSGPGGFDLV